MQYMHWSWEDYQSAPEPLVEYIIDRIRRENDRQRHDEATRKRKKR